MSTSSSLCKYFIETRGSQACITHLVEKGLTGFLPSRAPTSSWM